MRKMKLSALILAPFFLSSCASSGDGKLSYPSFLNQKTPINHVSVSGQISTVQEALLVEPAAYDATTKKAIEDIQNRIRTLQAEIEKKESKQSSGLVNLGSENGNQLAQLKLDPALDSLKSAIYFEYASANLNNTGKAAIDYLQDTAKDAKNIEIIGRADPVGSPHKNKVLADARANNVRKELLKFGISPASIKVTSEVALASAENRLAYKQNLPADLNAASRRADVNMDIKKQVISNLTKNNQFVAIPG